MAGWGSRRIFAALKRTSLSLTSVGLTSSGAATRADAGASLVKGVKFIVRNTKTWSNSELFNRVKLSEIDAYEGDSSTSADGSGSTDSSTDNDTESGGGQMSPDSDLDENPFG